ncbi:hypothetical protein BG003_002072 [Podila horticola]|nr:hypothetical protein BG003_002072 [Podila horticola]
MSLDSKFPPAKIFELQYEETMIYDVGIENLYVTIQDCSVEEPISKSTSDDGLRRYAFNLSGQMGLVVYNCTAKEKSIIRNAPGTKNWVIGFNGPLDNGADNKVIGIKAVSFAPNSKVTPRSLYWSQLIERMGGNSDLVERTVGPFFRE